MALPLWATRRRSGVPALFCTAFFSSLLTMSVLKGWQHDLAIQCSSLAVGGNESRDVHISKLQEKADNLQVVPELERRPSPHLVGPATSSFRDNLRNDTLYLTAIFDTGWTNEVMVHGNLIYLSLITERVPILPPFAPSHIGEKERLVPFGEVFDVPRLSEAIHLPLVEWHELKNNRTEHLDTLGCWSNWATAHTENGVGTPRSTWVTRPMYIDISYTPVPDWAVLGHSDHSSFWKLAKLSDPEIRAAYMGLAHPSPSTGAVLQPDHQMMCFDMLYFVSADEPFEYTRAYSPAWHTVMKHAHFTPRLQHIADDYLRAIFDLPHGAPIPLFIAIHARHGDFSKSCIGSSTEGCFTPLAVWQEHVNRLRAELRAKKGVDVAHVIMTSDERDEAWWDAVAARGWYRVDHEKLRTVEKFDKWYPIFIDVVIQACSKGFLGTSESMLSQLAERRVRDWNDGIGRSILWNLHGWHPEAVQPAS